MLGLMASQPIGGALVARIGSRPLVRAGALLCALSLIPVSLSTSFAALSLAFLFVGSSNGLLDVSMNVHGLAVERRLGRPILATLHAAFSFGVLAAATAGGLVASAGVGVQAHMAGATVVAICVALLATRHLLPSDVDAAPEGPLIARPTRALAVVGLFAFCVLLSEGAVNDWAAVYLKGDLGAERGPGRRRARGVLADHGIRPPHGGPAGGAARPGAARARRRRAGGARHDGRGGRRAPGHGDRRLRGHGARPVEPVPAGDPGRLRARGRARGRRWRPCPAPATWASSPGRRWSGCMSELIGLRSALLLVAVLCALATVLAGAVRAPVRAR